MGRVEQRLRELGFELPSPPPIGKIEPVKRVDRLVFVSGHGPERDGKAVIVGRVGAEVSLEEGYRAAQLCALNCLASLKRFLGDLDRIDEIVKVLGFVNSAPGFSQQPAVMHGFTDLLVELFGERGRHARSAIGTSDLPGNIPVEVEMIVAVKD